MLRAITILQGVKLNKTAYLSRLKAASHERLNTCFFVRTTLDETSHSLRVKAVQEAATS